MRARADERQLAVMIAELRQLLDTIETGRTPDPRVAVPSAAAIVGWARVRSNDGFPTSSMGGSGAGPSWLVEGEDGREERVPVTSVEAAAVGSGMPDPVRRAAGELVRMLGGAIGDLRVAVGQQHAVAKAHGDRPAEQALADEMWCVVHLRYRMFEPRGERNNRCRWCNQFALAHGQDPPRELLELRSVKPRITQRDIDRALRRRSA